MKPRIRQVAAETLGGLADTALVRRLESVARDMKGDPRLRQAAVWTLGRSGRQDAAGFLVEMLAVEGDEMKRYIAASLAELSGLNHGTDAERWKAWWASHKDLATADWFQQRLSFQSARVSRIDGELLRARAQVMRLHQLVYTRLGVAGRVPYLQTLLDQDEPGVRGLAVIWAVEALPSADAEKQKSLGKLLQKLTHDSNAEVQRGAVLALGRLNDDDSFGRLKKLLGAENPAVKAAAIRALSLQARNGTAEGKQRLRPIVPLLQKALEDKTLEVVVEAAEALGALGAPEAGPVLTSLLRHPSENVRQTVAQALERVAEPALIDGLLRGLDDSVVTVRFSLLGALARAAGTGQTLPVPVRQKVNARLEALLRSDTDPGVRGRAATVLGECGDSDTLQGLWQHVLTGEGRVQEKAWGRLRRNSRPLRQRATGRALGPDHDYGEAVLTSAPVVGASLHAMGTEPRAEGAVGQGARGTHHRTDRTGQMGLRRRAHPGHARSRGGTQPRDSRSLPRLGSPGRRTRDPRRKPRRGVAPAQGGTTLHARRREADGDVRPARKTRRREAVRRSAVSPGNADRQIGSSVVRACPT